MRHLFPLITLLLLTACGDGKNHTALEYFPSKSQLSDGYVSKYFRHYTPANPDSRPITEVVYTKVQLLDGGKLLSENYNAGFDYSGSTLLRLEEPTFIVESTMEISRQDTFDIEVVQPVLLNWKGDSKETYQLRYQVNAKSFLVEYEQIAVRDTTTERRKARYFIQSSTTTDEATDEVIREQTDTSYYAAGLGFYAAMNTAENYRIEVELVEQMSVEEFEKRKNHDEHRVAWIDPERTFDKDEGFAICGNERFIADYYNSTPDGRYVHNKRAMMDTIFSNLDKSKLFDQSGRLVFRFVVNCEGKAGRFIAEGYDLNYQPMEFDPATIEHLYGILRKLKEWRPVVLNEEPRDAYFYITFNFEKGEIVDILP